LLANSEQIKKLKKLKDNNSAEFDKEFKKIEQELFNEYCFKKGYKTECEPAYCVDASTDKCIFLHEMRKLWTGLDISP